jgi:hypothetical protein
MTTTIITREQVRDLRERLDLILQDVADRFGCRAQIGTMRFTANNVRVPIEFSLVTEDGMVKSPEADAFTANAWRYGLHAEELGRWFTSHSGRKMRIVGCSLRSWRYPIIGESETGARFKFAGTTVRQSLDAQLAK